MSISVMPGNTCKIIDLINQHAVLFDEFTAVYLFGSILKHEQQFAQDVDILLVYDELSDALVSTVRTIRTTLGLECGMKIDLTVLSCEEEREVRFLDRLNSQYYKIK